MLKSFSGELEEDEGGGGYEDSVHSVEVFLLEVSCGEEDMVDMSVAGILVAVRTCSVLMSPESVLTTR